MAENLQGGIDISGPYSLKSGPIRAPVFSDFKARKTGILLISST